MVRPSCCFCHYCYLLLDKCTTGGDRLASMYSRRFLLLNRHISGQTGSSELFSHLALARYNKPVS
jgi:hypothetical protein